MRRLALALASLLIATPAAAHTGVGATAGLVHGAMHPIGGLDHVLAMVAVGLFAWLAGGRALWVVPAAFVGMMAVGGALGVLAISVPAVETGIALSVVVIGAMVALGRGLPLALGAAVVGVFAVFHGHAHGTEMPETLSGLAYGIGFMAATAVLHGAGILAGLGLGKASAAHGAKLVRAGGALTSLAGVGLLAGAF
ncbi:HupE/UreJ family protein [Roseospira navarrensis]|uniref:Urease accessory protein n=1 Tax=Roseospira navarrensis TaxID=140058 RepID=A0A7X2D5J0_9PROT|nr:HupE/UreJ family protein [Roseospira navarrensis]MQX37732.1 urease accessory protein [Roseospira navarrensis]